MRLAALRAGLRGRPRPSGSPTLDRVSAPPKQGDGLETARSVRSAARAPVRRGPGALALAQTGPTGSSDPDSTRRSSSSPQDHAADAVSLSCLACNSRADRSLAEAQAAARVGRDADRPDLGPCGRHRLRAAATAWSRQDEMLIGLTVGAPPGSAEHRPGRSWGLVAFSSRGLRQQRLRRVHRDDARTLMRHSGGVRIDHAMGLNRLWVVPEGAGAQRRRLSQPSRARIMLRLVALESRRQPGGGAGRGFGHGARGVFQDRLARRGRAGDARAVVRAAGGVRPLHRPPERMDAARPSAMTSTHDLPTVAGWWARPRPRSGEAASASPTDARTKPARSSSEPRAPTGRRCGRRVRRTPASASHASTPPPDQPAPRPSMRRCAMWPRAGCELLHPARSRTPSRSESSSPISPAPWRNSTPTGGAAAWPRATLLDNPADRRPRRRSYPRDCANAAALAQGRVNAAALTQVRSSA